MRNQDKEIENPTATTTSSCLSSPRNNNTQSIDPDPVLVLTRSTRQIQRTLIRYRECQRNHAASMGSHVLDGCGEFMPNGEEGAPESLKCAACDCHRNFHRKVIEGEEPQPQPQQIPNPNYYQPIKLNGFTNIQFSTPSSSLHRFSHVVPTTSAAGVVPPVMMAFGGAAESSSEDLNMFQSNEGALQQAASKKRFRTKFSPEQKEKMMEFAQKLGWRIQKHDEQEVQQFCSQVGVKRQVFKVWMHNNKQTIKKQQV